MPSSLNGGRRGGVVHLLDGAGARFSGRPLPAFTGRSEAASSVALVLHPRHAAPMRLGSRTVEVGNWAVASRGSGLAPTPCSSRALIR